MVLTDQPLKEVLQRMTTSDRMVKWSIKLSEYGLEFRPRQSIKAQAFANFVVECSFHNIQNQKTRQQSVTKNSGHQVATEKESNV